MTSSLVKMGNVSMLRRDAYAYKTRYQNGVIKMGGNRIQMVTKKIAKIGMHGKMSVLKFEHYLYIAVYTRIYFRVHILQYAINNRQA